MAKANGVVAAETGIRCTPRDGRKKEDMGVTLLGHG